MGGGDLNQKKSWHPQTMKNQEKVWKAEQAKNQELKRVNELRKEIDEERSREELRRIGESSGVLAKTDADKKLEWMYKNSTELINRDEYLLGRSIDKSFEILQEEEKKKDANLPGMKQPLNHVEHECIPFSIREYRNLDSTEQVDLQRKIMEDPLMLIKQREMESRRKILENPVKLKELHRILKTDRQLETAKKSKKSKKEKKSKKKHKKRQKSSDTNDSTESTDSENDLDAKLTKKYQKLKGGILNDDKDSKNLSLSKLLDVKYEAISKELDKAVETKRKHKSRRRSPSSSASEHGYRRDSSSRQREERISDRRPRKRSHSAHKGSPDIRSRYSRRTRSRSTDKRHSYTRPRNSRRTRSRSTDKGPRNRRRTRSRSPFTRQYNRHAQEDQQKARKRSSNSPQRKESTDLQEHAKSGKLTEEEKEARRREMMENAAWREVDRTQAVKKHREAYAREESQNTTREFDKNFINKEVKKAIANQSSVESRIRSNLNNIQRTSSSMNSNFARK